MRRERSERPITVMRSWYATGLLPAADGADDGVVQVADVN